MSGLVDAKSLFFRAKRRSAGNKNSVIAVIGQPKCRVFTRCRDRESKSLVIKSQLSAPASRQPWAGGGMRFLQHHAIPRDSSSDLSLLHGLCFPLLSAAREPQSVLLSLHQAPCQAAWSVPAVDSEVTWQTLAALSCCAALDFRENKQFRE